jgi:hypothetical protein
VNGYTEIFNFSDRTISGWVLDASDVVVYLNGSRIGSAKPTGTREDLERVMPGSETFTIQCTEPFTALDFVSGRGEVRAVQGHLSMRLKLTANGQKTLRHAAIDGLLAESPGHPALKRRGTWVDADVESVQHNVEAGLMSPLLVPIGLRSEDGSALVGKNGHLFLVDGSNSLLAQYSPGYDYGPGGLEGILAKWQEVFAARMEGCRTRGVGFLQTVIPEKLTALRECSPITLDGPTPLYTQLEESLRGSSWYVSGIEPFASWSEEDDPYLATDTHFSAAGAKAMFGALAQAIDPTVESLLESIRIDEVSYGTGDLTERFYGLPLYSRKLEPSLGQFEEMNRDLAVAERYFPPTGFIGRRFSWINDSAPSRLKVLVFGNSFFGGGDSPGQLAWWGKQFFQEFHHVWTPDFDWALVDEIRPDIVVGQTIERFLRLVPEG